MKNFGLWIFDFGLRRSTRDVLGAWAAKSKIETPKSKITRAFSLVEVLVALAIFALGAIILGASYVNVINSYALATRTVQAGEDLAFARSLILTQPDITKLQDGGDFDTASGGHAKWSVDIEPTITADLFTVTFTCELTSTNAGDPQKTVQTFMLLRPTWSIDPAARSQLRQDARNRINELQGKTAGMGLGSGSGAGAGKPKS